MIEVGQHTLPDGRAVEVVEIEGGGLRARVATLGAALLTLEAPDAEGRLEDVTLGHATLAGYVDDPAFLGVAVGRTAGRIRGATIEVDGTTHRLDPNNGANTLHSGPSGLHAQAWTLDAVDAASVMLSARSPAGAGGYPGDLDVRLRYTLAEAEGGGGALRLDWEATASAPTPVALTHHAYWNLGGPEAATVLDHTVQSSADRYVVLADDLTPTGATLPVEGTPFDLRTPTRLGGVVCSGHPQIRIASGLDHDLCVPPRGGRQVGLRHVARVEAAGRAMDVWTTEPCVHLYDGAFLDVAEGKGGAYGPHAGLAIETQPPPDALAHESFPDILLRPGETFRSQTVYGFSGVEKKSR
ncbi:MAG: aldose epimerase family protein [Bacteroidota bacterium]